MAALRAGSTAINRGAKLSLLQISTFQWILPRLYKKDDIPKSGAAVPLPFLLLPVAPGDPWLLAAKRGSLCCREFAEPWSFSAAVCSRLALVVVLSALSFFAAFIPVVLYYVQRGHLQMSVNRALSPHLVMPVQAGIHWWAVKPVCH